MQLADSFGETYGVTQSGSGRRRMPKNCEFGPGGGLYSVTEFRVCVCVCARARASVRVCACVYYKHVCSACMGPPVAEDACIDVLDRHCTWKGLLNCVTTEGSTNVKP